ncbi:MAG: hypothetical protein CL678_03050 [Bdellovibrionaceae bacterium]|nr:hypothetical protein [Pseudobdellovibrionaceae bacterium]|tara:strand:+ start:900 stop:2276 length:1377 start_codon:yes stop_codon:yes gene_type:complete
MKKELKDFINSHSKVALNRRDLLKYGLIGFSTYAVAPRFVWGKSIITPTQKPIPFLVFDLAGGAALSGNFLVGKKGGPQDLLSSYQTLGWNPRQTKLDETYGIPMAGDGVSKILTGLNSVIEESARKKLKFSTICNFSRDDTGSNPLSALALVMGTIQSDAVAIASMLGIENSTSGGRSSLATGGSSGKPVFMGSADSLTKGTGVFGRYPNYSRDVRTQIVDYAKNIGEKLADPSLKNRRAFFERVKNSYTEMTKELLLSRQMDGRLNSECRAVYQLEETTDPTSRDARIGTLVYNVLAGNTGPGVVSIGGCDYHNGTQNTGDQKDQEIGVEVGKAVELARRLKTPLFIQIITDGGIYSQKGSRVWQGDSGNRSLTVMGYYDPAQSIDYADNSGQIGAYTDGEGVDTSSLVGDSPFIAAKTVLANYLVASKREQDLEKYLGRVLFDKRDQMIAYRWGG